MAVATCVLPVPDPPMRTAFCAVSVNSSVLNWLTNILSTLELSKSKPARARCGGNLAAFILWRTDANARGSFSGRSKCSINQREVFMPTSFGLPSHVVNLSRPRPCRAGATP